MKICLLDMELIVFVVQLLLITRISLCITKKRNRRFFLNTLFDNDYAPTLPGEGSFMKITKIYDMVTPDGLLSKPLFSFNTNYITGYFYAC